ncbi:MAG: site-2 protease family protein, partial [Frankiales bacterium]|nr:site-2 protease family protein [Frankiales bacterium]
SESYGTGRGYTAAGAFAVLLLVSVLLHEIGHCVVARAFGLPVKSITVTFLAGLTEITEPPQTPAREYAVAVIGPLISLLLAGVGFGLLPLFEQGSLPYLLSAIVALSNGLVAAFNLLPGLPLDGGRVLRSALWQITGDPDRSTVLAAQAGRVVAVVVVPVLLLGVLPGLGVTQLSVSTVLLTALVAAFIYVGANATLKREAFQARVPRASVAALARPAVAVPAGTPLAEAVRQAQEAGVHGVVVVDGLGRPEAVVNEAALLAVPEDRRPWVAVSTVARRIVDGMVLDASLSGEALLAAMRALPASEYVVEHPLRVLATADVAAVVTPG